MHELKLMSDLVKKIEGILQQEKPKKILHINVWLGALSHISAEHFPAQLKTYAKNTLIEHAKILVEKSEDTKDPHAEYIILKDLEIEP